MKERFSRAEISKDALQDGVQAAAGAVGQVATIVTGAVKDVAGVVGGLATELFEIRDAARRAEADHAPSGVPDLDADLHADLQADPDSPGSRTSGTAADLHADPDAPTG